MKRFIVSVLSIVMLVCLIIGCSDEESTLKNDIDIITTPDVPEQSEIVVTSVPEIPKTDELTLIDEHTSTSGTKTIGGALRSEFKASASSCSSTEELVNILAKNDSLSDWNIVVEPVTEGYLSGFDADITGFSEGTRFAPMIGTIPFVGYVFKTDDVSTLFSSLNETANLNWNICTSADELIVEVDGDYVLCVMSPYSTK